MKVIGIAAFVFSAAGVWASLHYRQVGDEVTSSQDVTSNAVDDAQNWDQANRRPTKEIFFCEVPTWMGGSPQGPNGPAATGSSSREAVSSGVQGNPFSE